MQVVFFGTSAFAVTVLSGLAGSRHDLAAVVTQPAARSGRGRKLVPSPVEVAARTLRLEPLTPKDPHDDTTVARLRALRPDAGVLAAYGTILRDSLLSMPRFGIINVHPSLLPAYRGAAPVQRTLMDGCTATGVSIIKLTRKVDAGDLLAQEACAVRPDENAAELSERLAVSGTALLLRVLDELEAGTAQPRPQDSSKATPAPKIGKSDRPLDWTRPALELHNRVRALSPEPGATARFRDAPVLVLRSRAAGDLAPEPPGSLLLDRPGLAVATGSGILELVQVKPENSGPQTGADFRNGRRPVRGERFE